MVSKGSPVRIRPSALLFSYRHVTAVRYHFLPRLPLLSLRRGRQNPSTGVKMALYLAIGRPSGPLMVRRGSGDRIPLGFTRISGQRGQPTPAAPRVVAGRHSASSRPRRASAPLRRLGTAHARRRRRRQAGVRPPPAQHLPAEALPHGAPAHRVDNGHVPPSHRSSHRDPKSVSLHARPTAGGDRAAQTARLSARNRRSPQPPVWIGLPPAVSDSISF